MIIMTDNHIEIKERRASLVAKGIIFLFLAVFSLTIALLPYIVEEFKDNSLTFYLAGGIAFCFFATMFIFLLFKECKPDNILILNSRGFTDNKNIGSHIVIEWTNVATVKLMGKKETPFLGITLENADLVMVHMKKPYAEEMRENIEEGLPHILLSQKEIRYPINELKDLFVKFTREARALKNDMPTKPKNNPFTREDVLRAFGQLDPIVDEKPDASSEVKEEPIETNDAVYENSYSNYSNSVTNQNIRDEEQSDDEKESEDTKEIKSVDSFYEMILKKAESVQTESPSTEQISNESANDKNDTTDIPIEDKVASDNDTALTEDTLSEDIMELLSKAKSSKIAEIEKLLSENDISDASSESENEIEKVSEPQEIASSESPLNEAVDEGYDSNESITEEAPSEEQPEEEKPVDNLLKDEENDENPLIMNLDAPEQSEMFYFGKEYLEPNPKENSEETKKADNMGDTKEFYPEIIHFDDI